MRKRRKGITKFIKRYMRVLLLCLISLLIAVQPKCACRKQKILKSEGKSAISILHPDGNSGVRGIVTIHQQNELAPTYF
jgi:hypothetical protein